MKKKILIVTPKFPYPSYGACEADRAAGIELLIKLGFDVSVITKVYTEAYKQEAIDMSKKLGISVIPVTYKYLHSTSFRKKIWQTIMRCIRPWYLDGAAYEYSEPEIQQTLIDTLDSFKPDIVWFDYTYLWPLYRSVRKRGIPIVTRSINFEPGHFLDEDGRTIINYVKFIPKLLSEYITGKMSDVLFAITPQDQRRYQKLGFDRTEVLPLRSLARLEDFKVKVHEHRPLHVFFAGSTYNVHHNRAALELLLKEIIPEAHKQFSDAFMFHIIGGKIPEDLKKYFQPSIIKHDYLPDREFEQLMTEMDIALIPSLYGGGMQQKIFEPIARGIPTITSKRGLAGFSLKEETVLLANTITEFVQALGSLRDKGLREKLSRNARIYASNLFFKTQLEKILMNSLSTLY